MKVLSCKFWKTHEFCLGIERCNPVNFAVSYSQAYFKCACIFGAIPVTNGGLKLDIYCEDYMSIHESMTQLNDGRIAGFRVIEITESPSIIILTQYQNITQAQQISLLSLMRQLSALSREAMRICESSSHQIEYSFELAYSTTPVNNQRYSASIRMFYVIRVIGNEGNELSNLMDQIVNRFESSLVAAEYYYAHINTEDFCNLLHEKIFSSAKVVVKDVRIHNLQSPTLQQCFSFDRLGALDYTKKNLYYSLVQHPHCYLSIQLIPAQYSRDEKNLIAGNSQLLDNLLKGVSDQGGQTAISYTAARKDAQTYAYYTDFAALVNQFYTYSLKDCKFNFLCFCMHLYRWIFCSFDLSYI